MNYEQRDLEAIVDYRVEEAIVAGHPPLHLNAWRKKCASDELANENSYPGYITRAAAGIRARAEGKRLTYCTEVRGTHAQSYIYDPQGTDPAPDWWNRDAAKLDENRYREQRGLKPYA